VLHMRDLGRRHPPMNWRSKRTACAFACRSSATPAGLAAALVKSSSKPLTARIHARGELWACVVAWTARCCFRRRRGLR
jgi:hypothetical protein